MKKCKLSHATKKKWIRLINETLDNKTYGDIEDCLLCQDSKVLNPNNGTTANRPNCIKYCIVVKFLKASSFKFNDSNYPCNDYFVQEYNKPIDGIRTEIIKSYLRQIKSWLKK